MPTVSERIGSGRFVAFELWPPRSAESALALEAALEQLAPLGPAFVAVTYGAGGSTRERTHDLVVRMVESPLLPLAHLTCAAHHRHELVALMQRYRRAGVDNLLALHGDPPLSATEALPQADRAHQAAKLREADFGLSQFFHKAEDYFKLVEELAARGPDAPIIPGIRP